MVYKRSLDGGATWTAAAAVALANGSFFYTNPQGLVTGDGRVFIEFMRCRVPVPAGGSSFVNCTAVVAESDDSGASFRDFRDVTPEQESSGGFGGIETAAGRLIFSSPGSSKTGVLYSDDAGASWAWGAPAAGAAGENEVAEIRGGALLMTVRRSNNTRLLLSSPDGGLSWSAPSARSCASDV